MYNQALGVLLRACVLGDGVVVERLPFTALISLDAVSKDNRRKTAVILL
jgi:hypothetical protein